jgi:tetratricopeptide (TPR) repeat protein
MTVFKYRQILSPVCVIVGLLSMAPLFAADAEQSDAVLELPALDVDAVPELDEQTALEISRQISLYQGNLEALESELGPYDPSLIELLKDMGRFYLDLGQYESAAAFFERALSITRISDGLYSQSQLEVLVKLISAYKAAGDWQAADDKEHLALHIETRLYEPGSQAYANAALAFGAWKLQAVRGNLLQRSAVANMRDIEDLQYIYEVALGNAEPLPENAEPMRSQTRFDLLYGKAYAEAQLADYALRNVPMSLNWPVERYVSEYVCRDVVNSNGKVTQSCGMVRRENPRYREYEMQRQLYRDRIQFSVTALRNSIDELRILVDSTPNLQTMNDGAAAARVEELNTLYTNINRDYRRSVMRW